MRHLIGLALAVPLFVPSRWRSQEPAPEQARTSLVSTDWDKTAPYFETESYPTPTDPYTE